MQTQVQAQALAKVERCRVKLIAGDLTTQGASTGAPWFGALSSRLLLQPSTSHPLMATDGTTLFYNEAACLASSESELVFVWAHEVLHCGLLHMFRKPTWVDWHEWNVCTDLAVNDLLIGLHVGKPPAGILYEPQYHGMSAEQIAHARRKAQQQQQQQQEVDNESDNADDDSQDQESEQDDSPTTSDEDESQDDGAGDATNVSEETGTGDADGAGDASDEGSADSADVDGTGGAGDGTLEPGDDCLPPPVQPATNDVSDDDGDSNGNGDTPVQPATERDWQEAVEQSTAISRKAGTMPGTVERMVAQGRISGTDWREVLRKFVETHVVSRHSWAHPNKRHVAGGLYLPSRRKSNTPPILLGVDCSGSVTEDDLAQFGEEANVIWREAKPRVMYVVYHDTDVSWVDVFVHDADQEVTLAPHGGGGTNFQPLLDYAAQAIESGEWEAPTCAIWLTDCEAWDTYTEPDFPVLFARVPGSYQMPLFGEVIDLG